MDIAFGTFKESFTGEDIKDDGPRARDDAKSSLRNIPSNEFLIYGIYIIGIAIVLFAGHMKNKGFSLPQKDTSKSLMKSD